MLITSQRSTICQKQRQSQELIWCDNLSWLNGHILTLKRLSHLDAPDLIIFISFNWNLMTTIISLTDVIKLLPGSLNDDRNKSVWMNIKALRFYWRKKNAFYDVDGKQNARQFWWARMFYGFGCMSSSSCGYRDCWFSTPNRAVEAFNPANCCCKSRALLPFLN